MGDKLFKNDLTPYRCQNDGSGMLFFPLEVQRWSLGERLGDSHHYKAFRGSNREREKDGLGFVP